MKRIGDTLSDEIWIQIFQDLEALCAPISCYRLICRQINNILVSVVFRDSHLDENVISPKDDTTFQNISKNVKGHCTSLDCGSQPLEWNRVAQFIKECRKLRTLKWNFSSNQESYWMPPAVTEVLEQNPHIKLHFKTVPATAKRSRITKPKLMDRTAHQNFPISQLVSFESRDPLMCPDMRLLWEVLAQATALKELCLDLDAASRLSNFRFFSPGIRLPAIEKLHFMGKWDYSTTEMTSSWNLTKLKVLKLIDDSPPHRRKSERDHTTYEVLNAAPDGSLEELTHLEATNVNYYTHPFIRNALNKNVKTLEVLRLRAYSPMDLLQSILEHSSTLHTLNLEQLVSPGNKYPLHPIADYHELAKLSSLVKVSIDLALLTDDDWVGSEKSSSPLHRLFHRDTPRVVSPECESFCDNFVQTLQANKQGKKLQQMTLFGNHTLKGRPTEFSVELRYRWNAFGHPDLKIVYKQNPLQEARIWRISRTD